MKLFGQDVTTQKLMERVKERLASRGLLPPSEDAAIDGLVEAPVDAFTFTIEAMTEHADSTRGLPIETHRDGVSGRAVVLVKQAFRRLGQLLINEALARQVSFNGHVLDGYAQLSAEVVKLRTRVAELEAAAARRAEPAPGVELAPHARQTPRATPPPRAEPALPTELTPRVEPAEVAPTPTPTPAPTPTPTPKPPRKPSKAKSAPAKPRVSRGR